MPAPEESENLIEFQGPLEIADPAPYRAVQAIPEWLARMEPERPVPGNDSIDTIKRCPPFLDAISCGYIIPLRRTVRFTLRDAKNLKFESIGDDDVVMEQMALGYKGAPFENSIIVKFINSWIVKTPPGYSTLFLPLLNRFDFPFQILAGLVETDVYYRQVYFPSICMMRPGSEVVLEKGTPLVQAIPIKREAWRAQTSNWAMQRRLDAEVDALVKPHQYKHDHWEKKEYR